MTGWFDNFVLPVDFLKTLQEDWQNGFLTNNVSKEVKNTLNLSDEDVVKRVSEARQRAFGALAMAFGGLAFGYVVLSIIAFSINMSLLLVLGGAAFLGGKSLYETAVKVQTVPVIIS